MKKLVAGLAIAVVLTGTVIPAAEAARRGGGFGGGRSYSAPRSAPRPALRQDWQRQAVPAPTYRANSAPRVQTGGQFNPRYGQAYQRTGYNPTARQSSMFANPWFWGAMAGGYFLGSSGGHAQPNPAATEADFAANCRAAATAPDKPADLNVSVEECDALAKQAFAKVQAESGVAAVSDTVVAEAGAPAPVGVGTSGWLLALLGAIVLLPIGLGMWMRRRK